WASAGGSPPSAASRIGSTVAAGGQRPAGRPSLRIARGGPMVALTLVAIDGALAVCRLAADAPLPAWAVDGPAGPVASITRTADELSIVCQQGVVPEGVRCEPGWRALRVVGTLDLAIVGALATLLAPFAAAGVAVFVVSTFDTDYLLVKEDRLDAAVDALRL